MKTVAVFSGALNITKKIHSARMHGETFSCTTPVDLLSESKKTWIYYATLSTNGRHAWNMCVCVCGKGTRLNFSPLVIHHKASRFVAFYKVSWFIGRLVYIVAPLFTGRVSPSVTRIWFHTNFCPCCNNAKKKTRGRKFGDLNAPIRVISFVTFFRTLLCIGCTNLDFFTSFFHTS